MKKLKITNLVLAAAMALLATSCVKDDLTGDKESGKAKVSVTMNLEIPTALVETRAVAGTETEVRENTVGTLDVLFFNSEGANSANPLFQERRHLDYVASVELGKLRAVIKDLPQGHYWVMVVGNAGTGMFDALTTTTTLAQAKSTLVSKQSSSMPDSYMLMAGVSTKEENITQENQQLATITLVRAVARIDVTCGLSGIPINSFDMVTAEIRNARNQSYTFGQSLLTDKNTASFPAGATPVDYIRPLITGGDPAHALNGKIEGQLYAYENTSPNNTDKNTTTCLIVGGKFNGSDVVTYYRIDLRNSENKYVIKRNHRYTMTITSVLGPGYGTKEEAEDGFINNMKVEIQEWVEGGASGIVIEGDRMMSVAKSRYEIGMNSAGDEVSVQVRLKSLNPDMFSIKPTDPTVAHWIKADENYTFTKDADGVYNATIKIDILGNNTGKDARSAKFVLNAGGTLSLQVEVVQGNTDRIMIVTTKALEYKSDAATKEEVKFSFKDANHDNAVSGIEWVVESYNTPWLRINTTAPAAGKGGGGFYIDLDQYTQTGYSRQGQLRLTLTEADGNRSYYILMVTQFNTKVDMEIITLSGVQQSLKIPDGGYTTPHVIGVETAASYEIATEGFTAAWQATMSRIGDGGYRLSITATPVADRATADPLKDATCRIGYIHFKNNGVTKRTLLVYQGYVKTLPVTDNGIYLAADNKITPEDIIGATSFYSFGVLAESPDKYMIYDLIAFGQRVWLDRNINARQANYTGCIWPDIATTEPLKHAYSMGTKFLSPYNNVFAHPDPATCNATRAKGPCPLGFRVPTRADAEKITRNQLPDDMNKEYPFSPSYSTSIFTAVYDNDFTGVDMGASKRVTIIGWNGVTQVNVNTYPHTGMFYRCVSNR